MTTTNDTQRLELIRVCRWNDASGVWTDEECRDEGMDPSTVDGLGRTIIVWLWEVAVDELDRRHGNGQSNDGSVSACELLSIVRHEFHALFGRDATDRDNGIVNAAIACVVFSNYGNEVGFDAHACLAGGAA